VILLFERAYIDLYLDRKRRQTMQQPPTHFAPEQEAEDPASKQMLDMLTGFFVARCIATVAELRIADSLRDRAKSVEELARDASADAHHLLRIMLALQSVGIFAQDESGKFRLTPVGERLRSDVAGSLRAAAAFMGHPRTWSAWGKLTECVITSEPAFDLASGMSLFDYAARDEEYCALFNDAMRDLAAHSYRAVVAAYDFSGATTVVDVGGGTGTLLALILKSYDNLRGVLFDQAQVVAKADPVLESYGVTRRCAKVGGDFFRSVPAGGDTYLLATVIHDWDDERCVTIIRNCRRAMREGGKMLLVETLIPDLDANDANVLDVEMLVMTPGGRERTSAEYRHLLREGGFELKRIVPTRSHLCIIEGVPV
jgi:SAM-dependent methyltransferase